MTITDEQGNQVFQDVDIFNGLDSDKMQPQDMEPAFIKALFTKASANLTNAESNFHRSRRLCSTIIISNHC
jgi:hypothetical protein